MKSVLDDVDRQLLEILLRNARAPLKELAAEVGLSAPSVAERMRRLQERGVIRAFTVEISPEALGFSLQAIVRVRPLPGQLHLVRDLVVGIPEVAECDKVTGDDCFIVRLHLRSIDDLDRILDGIAAKAETSTAIVKSRPMERRPPPLGRN